MEIEKLLSSFFQKNKKRTNNTTLANYDNNILVPGGSNGNFYTHINYHTIKKSLEILKDKKKDNYIIVETGCSAHGTKSTLIWDAFVKKYGGNVFSVDLNNKAVDLTNRSTSERTKVICSNSLDYLPTLEKKIDFLYLDSYDVDFLNPGKSAEHHLKEFNCVRHLIHDNTVVLIDDTPVSPEWLDDGKNNGGLQKI